MKGSSVYQTYVRVKGGLCITDVTCRWVRPKDTNMSVEWIRIVSMVVYDDNHDHGTNEPF